MPLELTVVVQCDRQPDVGHRRLGKMALIAGVVDREYGANALVVRVRHELRLEVYVRERRLPVMRVNDARRLRHDPRQCDEHGTREERVAARIVGIVTSGRAVESFPVEVQIVLDEDNPRRIRWLWLGKAPKKAGFPGASNGFGQSRCRWLALPR